MAGVTHNITTHTSVQNAIYSICLKITCIFFKISQTFKCLDFHCHRQRTVTQSDKGLAKIVEGASPRRHAETSPVKVKDTHLMNNKLTPADILCGEWAEIAAGRVVIFTLSIKHVSGVTLLCLREANCPPLRLCKGSVRESSGHTHTNKSCQPHATLSNAVGASTKGCPNAIIPFRPTFKAPG